MPVRLSANAAFECLFRVRLLKELKEAVIYLFTGLCASLCERVGLRSSHKSYLCHPERAPQVYNCHAERLTALEEAIEIG